MLRTPLLSAAVVLLAALVSQAQVVEAQSAIARANALAGQAREAYHNLDMETASTSVAEAVAICENEGCADNDLARLYMLQGMIVYGATNDRQRARTIFRQAVQTDQSVELDGELATPELQEILIDAREDVMIGGGLTPNNVAQNGTQSTGGREGASCRSNSDCADGFLCSDDMCQAGEAEEEEDEEDNGPWNMLFVEVGYSVAGATVGDRMEADTVPETGVDGFGNPTADPQNDDIARNDSFYQGGTNGCDLDPDQYCVRVSQGRLALAHGIHVGIGAYFTPNIGASLRFRYAPVAGEGTFSNMAIGARFHYRFVVPRPTGFHAGFFLGASFGQFQVQPKQQPTTRGGDIDRPFAQTGLIGVEAGGNLGYRFHEMVGIFVQPSVYVQLPEISTGLQLTVGIDVSFIGRDGGPEGDVEPELPPIDDDPDRDRIPGAADACPDQPEDIDGFEDEDGCPEEDNDGDGLDDHHDNCPREAEDMDGFEDEDGCPERDNDGDGVADADDQCANEPGPGLNNGCPEPDSDNDGIPDRYDNCPTEPGTEENRGCVEEQLVVIEDDRIVITDRIYFRTNRDTIERRSFNLLNNIASVLNSHPNIAHVRIEGHTDSRGRASRNLRLSERRAQAVMRYLVNNGGVDSGRLEAHGYGSTRMVVPEASSTEEHAQNRRVEFVIVHD